MMATRQKQTLLIDPTTQEEIMELPRMKLLARNVGSLFGRIPHAATTLHAPLAAAKSRSPVEEAPALVAVRAELSIDPLRQNATLWRGKRVNLPLTAQRILLALYEHKGQVVSYDELFQVVKSGRNRDNIRKHVSTIREAFREIDPDFDGIENVPMRGFRWATD